MINEAGFKNAFYYFMTERLTFGQSLESSSLPKVYTS